jgi:hypothetical protein
VHRGAEALNWDCGQNDNLATIVDANHDRFLAVQGSGDFRIAAAIFRPYLAIRRQVAATEQQTADRVRRFTTLSETKSVGRAEIQFSKSFLKLED